MSQITTHILDTMTGKPAEGITIMLEELDENNNWSELASGITNTDGRISDLLKDNQVLEEGVHRMLFQTKAYFENQNLKSFYPEIPIIFEITDESHYHIPLLLSPYGYSTYRGS
tara:strand:- start:451 stop:792 length:342 start_codon:yes stop_codon:yes gene_type:complete